MPYIEHSERLTGYRVSLTARPAFTVRGYTTIVPPGEIAAFWTELADDGRLQRLRGVSPAPPWTLGLGSWDPECPEGGQRYTVCIEATENTDFSSLADAGDLFSKEIGASDWLCFEITQEELDGQLWEDDPYEMMGALGYRFHTAEGDYSVGLHFDAYPPEYDAEVRPGMEFWITVVKA